MDNKFIWAIGGFVIAYFILKNKTKKEVQSKVDNAVATISAELHDNFNKAIDLAQSKGLELADLKQVINS